ncbi:hypothetical protein V8C43DRAFT_269287 [Trichoderma afarasin]
MIAVLACQTFFRCRRPLPTPSLSLPIFPEATPGQSTQKPCKPSIALITSWPKRLHERLLNMKRAWSDASAGTRRC